MKKESRKIGKEPKKVVLSLSKDKVILRAIIAGVCLFLGVGLIVNSCSNMINKSQYLVIEYPEFMDINGEEETLFNDTIDIGYYYSLDNEEDSRSIVMEKINSILNDNMVNLHKLCDYNQLYKENGEIIHNLKYVNDNPNEWVEVTDSLYNLLKTAEELREDTKGTYSIFSGKLYETWAYIFATYGVNGNDISNVSLFDPLYNEFYKNQINVIVESINKPTTYLEFNDETKEVKYNVSEEDKNNIVLDFGLLETSFYIDTLKKLFLEKGLDSGYITSPNGMYATLGVNYNGTSWGFDSYSYQTYFNVEQSRVFDYTIYFNGSLNYMSFNSLLNIKSHSYASINYYIFLDNYKYYVRSMIINSLTGYTSEVCHSSFTFSDNTSLIEQLKDNYILFFNDFEHNNDYLLKYENNEHYGAIVMFNDGNTNIEYDGNTTMLYSKLVGNYFEENYIPFVNVSEVVKAKIMAKEGE